MDCCQFKIISVKEKQACQAYLPDNNLPDFACGIMVLKSIIRCRAL